MAFLKPFSEHPEDRITGRTLKSMDMMGDLTGKRILNIGSLGGWLEASVMEQGSYEKLVGIDVPGTHIRELQEKYRGHPKVDFVEGSVLELPFEKNSFDIIAFFEVLEHIPKATELFALMEINRVLRKNGTLLLSTPYDNRFAKALDPFWYFGHRHYSKDSIRWLLDESGFFHYTVEVSGGWYELLTMIPFYFFKHIFKSEVPGKRFLEKKRLLEFQKEGFTNIFVRAIKNHDS